MILDKLLHGVLDQGRDCLILFDEPKADVCLSRAVMIVTDLGNLGNVRSCYLHALTGGQGRRFVIREGKSLQSIPLE